MADLFHLAYISRAVPGLGANEVEGILTESRGRNLQLGITGVLLHAGDSFFQILEGPKEAVEEVFVSIQRDGRHHWVTVIVREPIDQRSFPSWSMGFEKRESLPAEIADVFLISEARIRDKLSAAATPVGDMLFGFLDLRTNAERRGRA